MCHIKAGAKHNNLTHFSAQETKNQVIIYTTVITYSSVVHCTERRKIWRINYFRLWVAVDFINAEFREQCCATINLTINIGYDEGDVSVLCLLDLNAVAHIVSGTRKFDCSLTHLLHSELHWLDVPECIQHKLEVIVHRCVQGKAPQYLIECCTPTSEVASRQQLRLWRHPFCGGSCSAEQAEHA